MKRNRSAVLTLALASVLVLSACGDDDATDAAPTASATPTQNRTVCPTTATEVPAFPGVVEANLDVTTKPKPAKGPTPAPTALTYFDIVEGSGPAVKVGSQAKLKYVGALYKTGTEFDSSWKRGVNETFDIQACYEGAIVGFSVGPIGMKIGGRRQINIPAKDFGYGAEVKPGIPANSDLIFIVDLVSVDGVPPVATPTPVPTAVPSSAPAPTATAPTTTAPAATATP